jgi:hypothetical protein
MTNQAQQDGGTLLRSPDGTLYYLSAADMEAHRLPEDKAAAVREVIEGDIQGFQALPEDEMPLIELNTALGIPVAASKTKIIPTPASGSSGGL